MIFDHAPQPGPVYWDWRCLRCGQAVDAHASWWRRALWRRRATRAVLLRQLAEAKKDRDLWKQRWRDSQEP